jgi:hypothetical protein
VPAVDGVRTLVLGRPTIDRSWKAVRTFSALEPDVQVVEELPAGEVRVTLERLAAAS